MAKFLEFAIFCFVQMIAFFGILIGFGFVRPLIRLFQAIREGEPWQFSELARLTACIFGPILTGILLILGGIAWLVYSSGFRKRMRAFPEQPWLWRSDWADGFVSLSNRSVLVTFLITVSLYGLVVVPAGIYLASLKNAGLVYSFLGATGFFLLIFFRIQWANRLWNHSVLQMQTLPGIIGQQFSGLIVIPESFPTETTFQVKLKCEVTQSSRTPGGNQGDLISVLTDTQTTGKTRSTSFTSTVYEQCQPVQSQISESGRTELSIQFEIPNGLPSTGQRTLTSAGWLLPAVRVTEYHSWQIRVKTDNSSDLREAIFEVPVFQIAPAHGES
jgi:hypothetical protein